MSTAPATKAPKPDLPGILIADDQPDVLEALRLLLKGEGFAIETAASPAQVLAALEVRDFAAVLIDLNYARDTTSGQEGLDLLARIREIDASLPVVVMTAWASIELAVEAMRRGARDFIQKPWENARLLAIVRTESELFGHVKGAFTDAKTDRVGRFEMADGGTIFLDEIANVPMNLQPKLLRVLETGEFERVGSSKTRRVDVRILSATNSDLHAEVTGGRFRQDLLFRLNTIEIRIPPLRDRREDIPILAAYFLRQHAQRYRKRVTVFEASALRALTEHAWPGNVRELDHSVERAVLMTHGPEMKTEDLGLRAGGEREKPVDDMSLEEVECFLIKKALGRFDGNVSRAAEALGLSRSALYRRLQRYGL